MHKLSIALLILAAALPVIAKEKHKDKRFEPVETTASQAAGRYVGIDPDYIVELTAGGGTLRNFARTATLTNLRFDGSELTATAVYPGGAKQPLRATFVNRVKNGETAFGLMVHDADVRLSYEMMIKDLFCRRE